MDKLACEIQQTIRQLDTLLKTTMDKVIYNK